MNQLECLPYSVGHADEGVCLLVRMGAYRILLDCGLTSLAPLAEQKNLPPVDLVLCSHAHPDHAQGLLEFHRAFPDVPIYASDITAQLLPLNWPDQSDVPLFCQALPWRSPVEFLDGCAQRLSCNTPPPSAAIASSIPAIICCQIRAWWMACR